MRRLAHTHRAPSEDVDRDDPQAVMEQFMSVFPGAPSGKFLCLRVLVQNRQKEPVVVSANSIIAVGSKTGSHLFLESREPGEDILSVDGPKKYVTYLT